MNEWADGWIHGIGVVCLSISVPACGELERNAAGSRPERVINCIQLHSAWHNITNHLGTHPFTIACVLANPVHQQWRTERYLEIWGMLRQAALIPPEVPEDDDSEMVVGYGCNKGNHRSVAWQWLEARVFMALCFEGAEMKIIVAPGILAPGIVEQKKQIVCVVTHTAPIESI